MPGKYPHMQTWRLTAWHKSPEVPKKARFGIVSGRQGLGRAWTLARRQYKKRGYRINGILELYSVRIIPQFQPLLQFLPLPLHPVRLQREPQGLSCSG